MSIFVNKDTRVVVQGITGREGQFHASQCIDYGTNIVAGCTPGKGGQEIQGVTVLDTVREAANEYSANCSLIFVPPAFAADAILEAVDAGIGTIVTITEGIPVMDMLKIKNYLQGTGVVLIGPNCPGIITPGESKIGIMPGNIHQPGEIGVISRSGTLTYEIVYQLTQKGIGQSTCLGIGGDPVTGLDFLDCLEAFEKDPYTRGIVIVGEIGGAAEEKAAEYVKSNVSKPVVGFIAGLTAPPGKRMGHAGAIISGKSGTARSKIDAMREGGIHVCEDLGNFGEFCSEVFY